MIQLVKRSPGYVLYLIGAVVTLCLSTSPAVAQTPVVDAVLPVLQVEDKGELVLENDEVH